MIENIKKQKDSEDCIYNDCDEDLFELLKSFNLKLKCLIYILIIIFIFIFFYFIKIICL